MEKIFVTGGSGFIGTNLLQRLYELGHSVCSFDIAEPVNPVHRKFYVKGDILNFDQLKENITSFQPNYIFHFAARTDLDGATMNDYAVNTTGTSNLIKAANGCSSINKIVFASSMLVCRAGYQPKNDTDYSADTVYGQSKVEMEKIIRSTPQRAEWVIVRPTSIWGPWFKTPYRDFFDVVRSGRFVDIGDKFCTKTYGFIGNSIYQMESLLNSPASHGRTFYLGDKPPVFISDWAKEIASALNVRQPRKVPFAVMKIAAVAGDLLKKAGVSFPMTSFRLKNMTTNNIIDLSATYEIAPAPPFNRLEGVRITTDWLRDKN